VTTYTKPAVRSAWAEGATGTDIQDPGNTFAKAGWLIGAKPPRQYFNWVLNYLFSGIRYFSQKGIPDWDANETYPIRGVVTSNGVIYSSFQSNNINQNPSATLQSWWDIPYVDTAPAGDNSVRIANTHWVATYFLPAGSNFGALSGQIQLPQVPVGAVTQWQGSLSISGGQVTSAVDRANSLHLVGTANYAAFNWSGQSGQPTWLFGSNDGANVFVWNPANFNVANANTVAGLSVTAAASGNTVVARDAGGYIYGQYLNQASGNNENPTISQIMVTNGGDGFLRKASTSAVKAALGALATTDFPNLKSGNGYQKFPTGVVIQWGQATISGNTFVTFPIAFPSVAAGVVFTNFNSTNQIFLNGALSIAGFAAANGSATVSWLAVGY